MEAKKKQILLLVGISVVLLGTVLGLEYLRRQREAALPEERSMGVPATVHFTFVPTKDTIYSDFNSGIVGACDPLRNLSVSSSCQTEVDKLLLRWNAADFTASKQILTNLGFGPTREDAMTILNGVGDTASISRTLQEITGMSVGTCPPAFAFATQPMSLEDCKLFCATDTELVSGMGWLSYDSSVPKQQCRCLRHEPSGVVASDGSGTTACLTRAPRDYNRG